MAKSNRRKRTVTRLPQRAKPKKQQKVPDPKLDTPPAAAAYDNPQCREIAVVLQNTYRYERDRHINRLRSEDRRLPLTRWDTDLPPHSADQWLAVAHQLMRDQIDPEDFIRRLFDRVSVLDDAPRPADFLRSSAIDNYRASLDEVRRLIALEFRLQLQYATKGISIRQSLYPEETSTDAHLNVVADDDRLKPLFRFCLATSIYMEKRDDRFKQVADQYQIEAAMEYIRSPALFDEVWKPGWIPAWFRDYAKRAYRVGTGREAPTLPK